MTRTCNRCHAEKPLTEFHNEIARKHRKAYVCKKCRYELSAEWYRKNREYLLEKRRILREMGIR